ncbi:hypothetical protein D9756_001497 [Leucocoprinus leucothites]|uniref:UDP-galactose transporter n=1 Tax=Leucocoprinus leucothites TaxID=201217 RepID=A0A8H5G445_9AGAR|nr:hypothetical protein D9756_001497 [Leucoagaricus leucothites]
MRSLRLLPLSPTMTHPSPLPPLHTPFIRKPSNDRDDDDDDLGLANNAPIVQSVPSLWGIPLKYISLVTLAVQNSALTLIMHYSRVSTPPSRMYSAATAVLMNEILKGLISLVIAFTRTDIGHASMYDVAQAPFPAGNRGVVGRLRKLWREVFSPDCWKLSIPAILYVRGILRNWATVIQNNLQYVAATNLEAATFQVTYQMKILTTAAFSVILLRKKLSTVQWISLLFLALGVGIVQIQAGAHGGAAGSTTAHSMNALKGFMAVTAACFTSGLAGVYFEMVLKNSQADLWVRNVQLSLFSLLPALAPILLSYSTQAAEGVGSFFPLLFQNFGAWAWATVAVQVLGGLLTAMVIKYSDNILKGFATSLSIVISFLASVALFDFQMTFTFLLGSAVVLVATWLYNSQPKRIAFFPISLPKDPLPIALGWVGRSEKRYMESLRSPTPETHALGGLTAVSSTTSLSSISSTLACPPFADSEKANVIYAR